MRRLRLLGALGIVTIVSLAATSIHFYQRAVNGQRLFSEVAGIVDEYYVDSIGANALFEKAALGLVEQLNDPYSELIPPRNVETFERAVEGHYGGIGAVVESRLGNRTFIQKVYPNTPAENAGVMEGDEILAVDTTRTVGWEMGRVTERMRGTPGTKVKVTFAREGVAEPIVMTLTRAEVHIPAVPYALMLEPGIGYIPLQTFNNTSATEVAQSVTQLREQGATSLILDLRGNTGGILQQANAISSYFLRPGQPIVSVKGRTGVSEADSARGPHLNEQIPLVVLTDEQSASASEIVAGALQDHDRALVIGERTFGKGLVQGTYRVEGGYLLKVTTGKWFTPVGRSIHRDRELRADGRFEELPSDTAALPRYRTAMGRTLIGGGGIFPDIRIPNDTIPTPEQDVIRAMAPQVTQVNGILLDEAVRHKATVKQNFVVDSAWVARVNRRLDSAGVKTDPQLEAARRAVLRRELDRRIARLAFSDSGAARREFPNDTQLGTALSMLRGKGTQAAVFTAAKR